MKRMFLLPLLFASSAFAICIEGKEPHCFKPVVCQPNEVKICIAGTELCRCEAVAEKPSSTFCEIRVMYPANRPDLAFVGIPVNAQCDRAAAEIAVSAYLSQLVAGTAELPR